MKNPSLILTRLLLGATLLVPCLASAQTKPAVPDEPAIRKAVLETNAKMTQAANSLDVDGLFSYILDSDQATIIQNGTVFVSRQDAYQAVKRGLTGLVKVNRTFDNPRVTVLSADVALLAAEGAITATLADGRGITNRFAVSQVYLLKEGRWKLVQGHYSMPVNRAQ